MKKLTVKNIETGKLYIGSARQIKSLFKNLYEREIANYQFCDLPKFNMTKNYGLLVEDYDSFNERYFSEPAMTVITADMVLEYLEDERLI